MFSGHRIADEAKARLGMVEIGDGMIAPTRKGADFRVVACR